MTGYPLRKKRPRPCPAALEAALAARRAKALLPKDPSRHLTVVAVRPSRDVAAFAWEIRQFGAVMLASSPPVFTCATCAVAAGSAVLADWPPGALFPTSLNGIDQDAC